ncbi:hypothetical protein RJ639_047578 [Escallonia herrerae]|uniref:Uncharacterized protein n=1 Tax=Escallonia herrerae TaxID=1293975 RepID=A0AA88W5V0_9ASTE|nr:hypothetical protein RJ639_047578 [Escallonia herrerae]
MHQGRQVGNGPRHPPGDLVVGDVQHREPTQLADIYRNLPGELVSDQVEDAEKRQRRNAGGYGASNALPVGNSDAGEPLQLAYRGRDRTGHEPGSVRFLEDRVLGLATQVDVRDPSGRRVAVHPVPFVATVVARPRLEYVEVGLVQGSFERKQSRPIRRRATVARRHKSKQHSYNVDEGPHVFPDLDIPSLGYPITFLEPYIKRRSPITPSTNYVLCKLKYVGPITKPNFQLTSPTLALLFSFSFFYWPNC